MHGRGHRPEAEAAHQLAIAAHVETAAAGNVGGAAGMKNARQQVPGQGGEVMVHQMQLIVQAQQAQEEARLVEDDAPLVTFERAELAPFDMRDAVIAFDDGAGRDLRLMHVQADHTFIQGNELHIVLPCATLRSRKVTDAGAESASR